MKAKYQLRHQQKNISLKRNLFLAAIATFIVGFLVVSWFLRYWQSGGRPNDNEYPILGVSLSQEDGYQDFHLLKNHGVSFVYLKATQGASYFDDAFLTNYWLIQGTQLPVGVYHYFSFGSSPQKQFNNFQANVQQQIGSLPIVIQVHNYQKQQPDSEQVKKSVSQLRNLLIEYYHCSVIIEADPQFTYLHELSSNGLWLNQAPHFIKDVRVVFWQYGASNKIPSLAGDNRYHVSVFNGTQAQWEQFLQTGGS